MKTLAGVAGFFASFALVGVGGAAAAVGAVGAWAAVVWLLYFVWPADEKADDRWGDDVQVEDLAERIRRSVAHLGNDDR